MIANVTLTLDPAWPRMPLGFGTLALAAVLLVALTVWTYAGVRGTSWRRLVIVLALRLVALAVTVLLLLRPSFATEEEDDLESLCILVIVDGSRSMATRDENDMPRLEAVQKAPASSAVQNEIARLGRKKIEVISLLAADRLERYDATARPQGKGTDIAAWLDGVAHEYLKGPKVQAVLIVSDGGDTGDPLKTQVKAADFKGRQVPIHTFGVGQSAAIGEDKDIALVDIFVEPKTLLAKSKFRVKAIARDPGFADATTEVSLWIEDRATKAMKVVKQLPNFRYASANRTEIDFEADVPDVEGEIKIVVKSALLEGESRKDNNEIATYADVSKEGVRVLWVEGQRRWEFALPIRESLRKDRRFQVYADFRPRLASLKPPGAEMFAKPYDVVVIGDISASRFGDAAALRKMRDLVETKGMGVLMLGGYETFGNSDWARSELGSDFFPVDFRDRGQIDRKVRVVPTGDGLRYVLRLSDDPAANKELWTSVLDPLAGLTQTGLADTRATVLAVSDLDPKMPVLATVDRGKGRVMTFAGDTTSLSWRRTERAQAAYDRFWKQMILWLAHQENSRGNMYLDLDLRRVDRGRSQSLPFRTGFRGDVRSPTFVGKVIGPDKEEYPLPIPSEAGKTGQFVPPVSGEYVVQVTGKATSPGGAPIEERTQARFFAYEEDREKQRIAADDEHLKEIATAAGGKFAHGDEANLAGRLSELEAMRVPAQVRIKKWPDWRREPPSGATIGEQFEILWRSTALGCLAVYMACLCVEWYLRRRWGMA